MVLELSSGDIALIHLMRRAAAPGDGHVTLSLVRDPGRQQRALAHGFGHGLSYLSAELGEPERSVVLALGRAFASSDGPESTGAALGFLQQTTPAGYALRWHRAIPSGQAIPRWPNVLRSGPPLSETLLWPFDPEVAGLRAGTRTLIKRDWLTDAHRDADARWLTQLGLAVRTAPAADTADRHVLFAAMSEPALADAVDAERALGGEGRDSAADWLGNALGYPPCCRAAFGRLRRRDDLTLAAELLPPADAPAASALTQWLHGPLALVSHTPCAPDCASTRALAGTLLTTLEADRPGFAVRWRALAQAWHAIDVDGRCWSLQLTGRGTERRVEAAIELQVTDQLHQIVRPALELDGITLQEQHGEWRGPGFRAALVADHRAP